MSTIVRTQQELDAALADGKADIIIDSPRGVWLTVSGSATVGAWGSATVEAWDSATVEASDSATVEASGSATVRAWGSATVRASMCVAVHVMSKQARINGGVQIELPDLVVAANWLAYHGIGVTDGVAVLFKAVEDDWKASHKTGVHYTPGTVPEAPDWDPEPRECGGGLHLCARPWEAKARYHGSATRFVAVPVFADDIRIHPGDTNKVRVPRACAPVWECTIDGAPVPTVGAVR